MQTWIMIMVSLLLGRSPLLSARLIGMLSSMAHHAHGQDYNEEEGPAYCPEDKTDAVMGPGYQCIQNLMQLANGFPYTLYYPTFWSTYCSSQYGLPGCVIEMFEGCPGGYAEAVTKLSRDRIWEEFNDIGFFPTRGSCNGTGGINKTLSIKYEEPSSLCVEAVYTSLSVCIEEWMDEVSYVVEDGQLKRTPSNDTESLALTLYRCGMGSISPKCINRPTHVLAKFLMDQTIPLHMRIKLKNSDFRNNLLLEQIFTTQRYTVGVFGSHVQSYDLSKLVACNVTGNNAYIVNTFFAINATATPVEDKISALTVLNIRFFNKDGLGVLSYYARNGQLPVTFSNGATTGMAEDAEVTLTAAGDSNVTLRMDSLAVVISITSWRSYYSVALRMGESMFEKSFGLLVEGCVPVELGNTAAVTASLQDSCVSVCGTVNNTGDFQYSDVCQYDCIAVNSEFTSITKNFVSMVSDLSYADNTYSLTEPLYRNSAASSVASMVASVMVAILILVY